MTTGLKSGVRSPKPILILCFLLTVWNPASLALWLQKPGAVQLAKLSLMLFGIEAVARLSTRVNLSTAPPGTRLPLAAFIIVHNAAWYLYLQKSRRVQAAYGLESHPQDDRS